MALPKLPKLIKENPLVSVVAVMVIIPLVMGFIWAVSSTQATKNEALTKVSVTPTKSPQEPILEIFENPVQVKLPNSSNFDTAKNKQIVPEGTQIQTGSTGRAQIVFPGGTATRIDHNGLIKISQFSDDSENIMITILKGRVWSRIRKLLGSESYSTETSDLVATVRGTSYGHGIVEGGFNRGTVFKGKVQMTCKKDEENTMELIPNKKAMVNCENGSGRKMLDMGPEDMTDEWLLFNRAQDTILEKRFGKDTYADDDEVLGAQTSVTPTYGYQVPTSTRAPSPTTQPTNTPSSSNTSTSTNNSPTSTPVPPTPILTPAPSDTPIPPPSPAIRTVLEIVSRTQLEFTTLAIEGINLSNPLSILLRDPNGNEIGATSSTVTDTRIEAVFSGVQCSTYDVTVTTPGGTSTSKISLTSRCIQ